MILTKDATETNVKALSSFFPNRNIKFLPKDALSVGSIEHTLFGEQRSNENFVAIRFVKYFDEAINEVENELTQPLRRKRVIVEDANNGLLVEYRIGLEIRSGNSSYIFPLDRKDLTDLYANHRESAENFQFIRTKNIDRDINSKALG